MKNYKTIAEEFIKSHPYMDDSWYSGVQNFAERLTYGASLDKPQIECEHKYELVINGQLASVPVCILCGKSGSRINFIYPPQPQKEADPEIFKLRRELEDLKFEVNLLKKDC